MSKTLAQELRDALMQEFKFTPEREWLRKGRCPECGKRELFTHAETPRVLKCGRLNRCGYEKSVKSYFPEIFDDWSKRFKATEADPHELTPFARVVDRRATYPGLLDRVE